MAVKASSQISMIDVTDAYSVLLTSEAYAFTGNTSGAPAGLTCTTQVVAFCGQKSCTSLNVSNIRCPTGITATVSNNNTAAPAVTFKTTAIITATCEAIIPVSVDGITINKKFSFAVAKTGSTGAKGDKGQQGPQGPQGVKGDTGAAGKDGINGTNGQNGKSIGQVVNYYLATNASSNVTASISGWTTTVQSVSSSKKYLWNYEVVKYTDGTTASTTAPCIIGSYGDTGAKGDKGAKGDTGATGPTGVGIKSITEYYAVSTTNTMAPTSWVTSIPTLTASNKYLWNYETVTYTNNNTVSTSKRVIGVYGDKGAKGDAGAKGDKGQQGPRGPQGVKGDTGAAGNGIASTAVAYQAGSSGTTAPTGTWSTSIPSTSAAAPYLWTRITIKYTNGTVTNSYSVGSTPEGISVGGRNLLTGSIGWTKANPAKSTNAADGCVYIGGRVYLEKGKTYTLQAVSDSVWATGHGGQTGKATIWLHGLGDSYHRVFCGDGKTSGRYTWTFVLTSATQNYDIRINGYGKVTSFWDIKIESGNKATDWSPAPEDIDTKFNNYTTTEQMKHDFKNNSSELYSAINSSFATNGQVSAVDGKFSNYYTKTTIDSTIKQVKDSINLKVSQTDFDKQTKATSASLELKLNKTDNNKVVAMLNASADTISLKSNRFTLDSTYTKIAADGTITCSNLNCTNAKITGGSVNITASNKEENKIVLSYQDAAIKLAPNGITLDATRYSFKLTPMKLTMSFSGGGIESNTTIDPNGISTGSVKAGTIVASSILKIGPQSYGSNAATGARLEATNQDLRLYASPETKYYVRLGVDYDGSTVEHGWHFGPDGGGKIMLGTSSHAWSNGFFDGTVYIQHGDMHISTGSCYCYDYYYIWSGGGWVELSDWIAAKL